MRPQAAPTWTALDTLLLPIAPAAWPPPVASVALDGIVFAPKRELHATLVGRSLGAELRAAGARSAVLAACAALDWGHRRRGEWWWLHDAAAQRPRHSIIERIDLPALAPLYARLSELLGRRLALPPAHVTLYVAGDERGIGVPDDDALARLAVRRLEPGEPGLR